MARRSEAEPQTNTTDVTLPTTEGQSVVVSVIVDDEAELFNGAGTRDDAGQTKTLTLYAVAPDPNFPDLDGNGIPDNLPNPDEEVAGGGGGGGGEDDESSASFAATFEGLARACAGGLGDDVHAFTIMGTAQKPDGTIVPGATLRLSFENNRGEEKRAKFVPDTQKNQVLVNTNGEEMTVRTESNGRFPLTVRSSDTISDDITVKLQWENEDGEIEDVGEQDCDFAPPANIRRFGIKDYVEIVDNGWLFNPDSLTTPQRGMSLPRQNQTVPAYVYLKFQKDTEVERDNKYFLLYSNNGQGTPSTTLDANGDGVTSPGERTTGAIRHPLADAENWRAVNGHKLRVRIMLIINDENVAVSETSYADYCTIVDANGNAVSYVDVLTSSDGYAQLSIRGGPGMELVKSIHLEAKDLSISAGS